MNTQRENERDLWDLNESIDLDTPIDFDSNGEPEMTDAELEPYLAPWLGETGQPAFYRQIAQMDMRHTDEVEPQYGTVRCPVRLLWGQEDEWIPVERGRQLSRLLPECDYREVPGAGHLMQEDAPEAIVAAALSFFR